MEGFNGDTNRGPLDGLNEDVAKGAGFPPGVIPFVITFHQNSKRVDIAGPINDKVLCYGVLEMAKEAVKNYHDSILLKQNQKDKDEGTNKEAT